MLKAVLLAVPKYFYNRQISFWIGWMQNVKVVSALENVWSWCPENVRANPGVQGYYEFRKEELTEAGMLTISDAAGGVFQSLASDLVKGFGKLAPEMEGTMGSSLDKAIVEGSPEISDIFKDKLELILDALFKTVDPDGDKIPEETKKEIIAGVGPMLGIGVTFTVGTALAELIHPTKEMGWGRVSHFLYDTVGFKEMSNAYIYPVRLNLVQQPMKYNINRLTTPFEPPFRDATEWYGRGHIDEDQMLGLMRTHGINPDWLWSYARMGTKPSSYFMLNAIGREGFWDVDDFRFWLSDAGYGAFQITAENMSEYEKKYELKPPSTTQIEFLLAAYKQMNLRTTIADERAVRRSLLNKGWISREDFEKDLANYKITKEDAKGALDAVEKLQEVEEKSILVQAWERKFLYGHVDEKGLKEALKELGMREGKIQARVNLLNVRKTGKLGIEDDEKTLTNAQIIDAYELAMKEKTWAVNALDKKGYTTEDAVLLADIAERKLKEKEDAEFIRAFESRTLYGRLSVEDLKKEYVKLGKSARWAEGRALYIEERLLGKVEEEEEEE